MRGKDKVCVRGVGRMRGVVQNAAWVRESLQGCDTGWEGVMQKAWQVFEGVVQEAQKIWGGAAQAR